MPRKFRKVLIGLVFVAALYGCGDDDTNRAPIADAGSDQNVSTGSLVTLDGSGSSDADSDVLTYLWSPVSLPPGSTAALADATLVRPTVTVDVDGRYEFQLTVKDGHGESASDTVVVTAATLNSAPVAEAGPDQNVVTGSLVTLDGSGSSDVNGDPLTYAWSFLSRPAGSDATLSNDTAAGPTFTPDIDGSYVVQLIVDDGQVGSTVDAVVVTAATLNSAPVASAGPDQNVATNSLVTLDGSGSSDADGDALTYAWSLTSQPTGSTAVLSDATAVNPTFTPDLAGDYVLSLIVNDGLEDSAVDTALISVGFLPPATGYVAVNFTIDDTASPTYTTGDGLAWKGSFSFNADSRIITFNGSWMVPYVMLYDDGPWTAGGHEPAGATAADSLWGVTVWVSNATAQTFEYGAISGSVDGSDGNWIWIGANGTFSVPAGATTPIDAPGLVIP